MEYKEIKPGMMVLFDGEPIFILGKSDTSLQYVSIGLPINGVEELPEDCDFRVYCEKYTQKHNDTITEMVARLMAHQEEIGGILSKLLASTGDPLSAMKAVIADEKEENP